MTVHLTRFQLAAARDEALAALERAGVPPTHVVLGFTNSPHDDEDSTYYETHVGPTRDRDLAIFVQIIAAELQREANRASVALVRPDSCPACGSPRLAFLQRRRDPRPGERDGIYVETLDDCLDCDYRAERER